MVMLEAATIGPRGAVPVRPVRLMSSPFHKTGVAMQRVQPWANKHPENLSDAQIETVGHLINAAVANEGTYGTVTNPATGRPMPAIAQEVADYFEERDWTVSPEEQRKRRQDQARKRKEQARRRLAGRYERFATRLGGINSSARGNLIGV